MINNTMHSNGSDKMPSYEEKITELKTELKQKDVTITKKDYLIMEKDRNFNEIKGIISEKIRN